MSSADASTSGTAPGKVLLPMIEAETAKKAWSLMKGNENGENNKGSEDPIDEATRSGALKIINEVRAGGEKGLLEIAARFKDIESIDSQYWFEREDMKKAFESLTKSEQELLERTAKQIERFAQAQRDAIKEIDIAVPGGRAGHTIAPMRMAGCYAPGGNYPLPSSVLMTAVTARVAGVEKVIVASPKPKPVTLAAAYVAKADALMAIGGAQAVAALAYGCNIKDLGDGCDIIVGPGNKWVTAAKQIVSGKCAIDMLAGPSECLVVADDSADASVIAADLLAQAEHATDAVPIVVTCDKALAERVQKEVETQLETLTTAATARVACYGGNAIVLPNLEECIEMSNMIGPEHLEVMTKDAKNVSKKLTSYGGLFIGSGSAEVFGDYGVGPNHVLPTSGTAKYTGGLSVFTFLRIRTWLHLEEIEVPNAAESTNGNGKRASLKRSRKQKTLEEEQENLARDAAQLARLEGLEGHARAAEKRARTTQASQASSASS